VLESLVDRQNHQFSGPRQFSASQQPGDVRLGSSIIAGVVTQNFLNMISHVAPPGFVKRET
jgi:hypothetical protein